MNNKKKKIILIVVIAVLIILPIFWTAYFFPYNVPIRGKNMYYIALSQNKGSYYLNDYGFFPKMLPDDAGSVKMSAFSGYMQARPQISLSFITDEEYFKKEVERYSEYYNVYLFKENSEEEWLLVKDKYSGEYKSIEELKGEYSLSSNSTRMKIPYIPKKEWPDTYLFVLDEYCYIAYSYASGRIVYHLDEEYLNGYGDNYRMTQEKNSEGE